MARVRMTCDRPATANAAEGATGNEIDSRRRGTLMQIGSTLGRDRGQPDHSHHWHVAIKDDADVGRAANCDALHDRMHDDSLLDDGRVDLAAERIETGE